MVIFPELGRNKFGSAGEMYEHIQVKRKTWDIENFTTVIHPFLNNFDDASRWIEIQSQNSCLKLANHIAGQFISSNQDPHEDMPSKTVPQTSWWYFFLHGLL
jgi:hypothetical protein